MISLFYYVPKRVEYILTLRFVAFDLRGPGSAARQATSLRREGVVVHTDSMGEFSIDLGRYGWFPHRLPNDDSSEDSDIVSGEEDEDGNENHAPNET